jgi:asparagine synthase (glutamine-hydrolysing)
VRRHLVADVPVAVLLSGGFDSAALATLATQASESPIMAFTMAFPEVPEMSEVRAAAAIAARLGAEHHILELRESDLQDALAVFFSRMDQPSDDGLNVYLVSHGVARAGIKACLHGVGGDELFGGYPSFKQLPGALRLSAIPASLRRLLAGVVAGNSVARSKLANLLRSDLSLLDVFLVRRSVFSFEQRRALFGGEPPLGRTGVPEAWTRYVQACLVDVADVFAAISTLELTQYAGNKLLPDGDVMSMAHGLELRFPLLDVDLIRAVLATPEAAKRNKNTAAGKPLLTGAIRHFPFDLMSTKKQGFTLPLAHWMRRKGMRDERQAFMKHVVEELGLQYVAVDAVWRRSDASSGGQEWLRAWLLYALGGWSHQNSSSPVTGAYT